MKTRFRFALLSAAVAATFGTLAVPAQATPLTSTDEFASQAGAVISLQSKGYTVLNANILVTATAPAKSFGSGYTMIGTERDIAGQGSLSAKYTFKLNTGAGVYTAMKFGAGDQKIPNGDGVTSAYSGGQAYVLVVNSNQSNATADRNNRQARWATHIDFDANTIGVVGNGGGATVGGTTG